MFILVSAFWEDPFYSHLFLGGYLGLMTVLWSLVAIGVSRWGKAWRLEPLEPKTEHHHASDFLSIYTSPK